MIYTATAISGEKVDLGAAYSIQINKSREAPADSLTAVFFSEKIHQEYKSIDVFTSKNEIFFSGIIDEQKFEVTNGGSFLTIKSRSKAAYLIDNEATTQTYKRPSLDIIFKRHIEPYGFTEINGNKTTFNVTLDVENGMSEWDVLEKFCSLCLNTFPVVNADGSIDVSGNLDNKKILFSNADGRINFSNISQKINRHRLISEITVCEPYAAIYVDKIYDQDLINRGICRRKFINLSDENTFSKKISIDTVKQMISETKNRYREITVKCPGAIFAQIGSGCQINDYTLGTLQNLKIYEMEYNLNKTGEYTTFTLLEA